MINEVKKLLTIRDLAKAYNHKEYKLLINGFPNDTRKYLTRKSDSKLANSFTSQVPEESFLTEYESALNKAMQEFKQTDKKLEDTRKELINAELALSNALKAVSRAKEDYKDILYIHQKTINDISKERSIHVPVKKHESDLNKAMQEFKQTDKKLENSLKDLINAELTLSNALKAVSIAKENYNDILYIHQKTINDISQKRYMFESAKKSLTEKKHYIIVHSTATVCSLSRKINKGVLVCSQYDASTLSYKKHVDKVVNCKENYSDMIPDDAIMYFDSQEDFESAKAYVSLILKLLFEKADYELLYNSEGIKYILDSIM